MPVASRIETKQLTVLELLKTDFKYVVPVYQRDFAWRAEEEVKQLWDDVVEAMREGQPDYFLGTLVVEENQEDKIRQVIDGQQRLAVLSMIMSVIRSLYQENGHDGRANGVYRDYLGSEDRRSGLLEPRLTLNRTNQGMFAEYVVAYQPEEAIQAVAQDRTLRSSNLQLLEALLLLRSRISERIAGEQRFDSFLLDLEDYLKDRVVLIVVSVGDENDAYLIFETLNDRGLELSISDLLKNYIYRQARNRLEDVQRQWEEMVILLGNQDPTQFLRHYWLSKFGVVRERELYKQLRERFSTAQSVLTLMSELRDAADKYGALSNALHPIWTGYSTQARADLETLQLFGLSQFRPLLLAALDRLAQREIERLLRIVVVISLRYSIIGSLATSTIERAYSDAAVAIRQRHLTSASRVFSQLRNAIYPDDERFKSDFASKAIKTAKLARYILAEIADTVQEEGEFDVRRDEQRITLEHIMPKTRSQGWLNAAQDEEEYREYVEHLGNLTLIERDVNRAVGNTSFLAKRDAAYARSNIRITRELCTSEDWSVQTIKDRQLGLAEVAAGVWRYPPA